MAEVESLCDRIAILHEGRIAFCGMVEQLDRKNRKALSSFIKPIKGDQNFVVDNIGDALITLLEEYRQERYYHTGYSDRQGNIEQHFIQFVEGDGK